MINYNEIKRPYLNGFISVIEGTSSGHMQVSFTELFIQEDPTERQHAYDSWKENCLRRVQEFATHRVI